MNPTQTPRRLTRSRDDRWIAGVCGGLGRYFGLDPVIIRLAAVALTFAGGAGLIAYAGAWLLVPEEGTDSPLLKGSRNNRKLATIAGIVLVVCGAIALLDAMNFWFDSDLFWALTALAVGVFLLLRYTDLGKRFGVTPQAATPAGTPPPSAAAAPAAPGSSGPAGPTAGLSGPTSPPVGPAAGSLGAGAPPAGELSPGGPSSAALVPSSPAASPALPGDTAPTEPLGDAPTEPLLAPSPLDDLPPNDPALIEERRARRRRRRRTTGIAFGALLLALGVAGTLVAAGAVDVGTQTFLAGAVILTGLTAVVASFYGGAPGLIWVGLVLATGVGVVAAADIPIDKGVGDRVYRPATATALKPKYELGVGRLWIDMRSSTLPQGTTTVDAEVGIGELDVVVPDGARVVAHGEADIGDVNILGRHADGTDVDTLVFEPLRRNGELVTRTVRIKGKVGIGEINVYRGVDSPRPNNNDVGSSGPFLGGFASIAGNGGLR